jgi:hypothetical protein
MIRALSPLPHRFASMPRRIFTLGIPDRVIGSSGCIHLSHSAIHQEHFQRVLASRAAGLCVSLFVEELTKAMVESGARIPTGLADAAGTTIAAQSGCSVFAFAPHGLL